jgi:hypothetical protein
MIYIGYTEKELNLKGKLEGMFPSKDFEVRQKQNGFTITVYHADSQIPSSLEVAIQDELGCLQFVSQLFADLSPLPRKLPFDDLPLMTLS